MTRLCWLQYMSDLCAPLKVSAGEFAEAQVSQRIG